MVFELKWSLGQHWWRTSMLPTYHMRSTHHLHVTILLTRHQSRCISEDSLVIVHTNLTTSDLDSMVCHLTSYTRSHARIEMVIHTFYPNKQTFIYLMSVYVCFEP